MRQFGPCHGELRQVEIGDHSALAGNQRDSLAAKPRAALGKRRLVSEPRNDPEFVYPRNIGGGEDADDTGGIFDIGVEIAEGKPRVIMRRAHDEDVKCVDRKGVAAELFRAADFCDAVEPHRRSADGPAGGREATVEPCLAPF
jgi:hypothetical protein